MWDKILRRNKKSPYVREYQYASHHHLIPLYILSGVSILTLLVLGSFTAVLWQNDQRDAYRPFAEMSVRSNRDLYVPTVIVPAEQKQYVYSANVRFPVTNPQHTLRFNFDPGINPTRTSSTISLTTASTMQAYESLVLNDPEKAAANIPKLQECNRQYVIRFVPGLVPFGGYTSFQEIKLKDGRTAYLHKNINCVLSSTAAMTEADNIEKTLLAIESY